MPTRFPLAALLTAALALAVLPGCHSAAAGTGASAPATATGIVAEARVTAYPGADVELGADFAGTLAHVTVQEGDRVQAGQRLADFDASVEQAALAAAKAHIVQAQAEIRLAELRVNRGEHLVRDRALPREDLDERRRDLAVARAQLHADQADADRLRAEIAHSVIDAPFAGTIVTRLADPGETLTKGATVLRLADLKRLRLTADVDEFDADDVQVGDPVTITAEGFPGRQWQGRVEEVPELVTSRLLEPLNPASPSDVGVVRVKITLPKDHPFRLGQRVEVHIQPRTQAGP